MLFKLVDKDLQTSVKVRSLYNPELIAQYESWLYMKEYDDPLVAHKNYSLETQEPVRFSHLL